MLGEHVQRVHAEDHLLERAAGEPANDQQVERIQDGAIGPQHVHLSALVDLGLKSRRGDREHLVTASGEGVHETARVPRAGRAEHPDVQSRGHRVNDRSSTSGARPPPWWARPDWVLVSVTAAGLNSIGSMS